MSDGPFDGTPYLELTDAIGGIPWNINSLNWSVVLDRLGVQASGLRREFFLTRLPVPGTITVQVTQVEEGLPVTTDYFEKEDWVYDRARNSVVFNDFTPEQLSEIKITYTVLATAIDPGI